MNYYPFHIGDFASHTAHLSFEEDIAYRRMLDWYYLNEKALPSESMKVARLVRMPESIAVIEAVLQEFFLLLEDGWHNKRADEELASMLAKQKQQTTKDEHEAERMRRHRERRAQMFAALREVSIVPAWDLPTGELQRLYDENCNGPETHLQREQAVARNAPATAIPIPTPTPIPINKKTARERANPLCPKPDDVDPQTWADWMALRAAKKATVSETAVSTARNEAGKAGMTLDAFLRVWCMRGSQGLSAEWLKPHELATGQAKPRGLVL